MRTHVMKKITAAGSFLSSVRKTEMYMVTEINRIPNPVAKVRLLDVDKKGIPLAKRFMDNSFCVSNS